jgi:DNA-binding MurR/RpiR family transcriptional regulator
MSERTKTKLPDTYDGLKALITERYPEFRGQMKRIAEHAIENPNDMALKTVAQMAEDIGVQPSSMVRFAKGLEYDGFSALQHVFRNRLINAHSSYAERIRSQRRGQELAEHADASDAVLTNFVEQGIASLETLRLHTPPTRINQAIQILADAKDIYLLAQRRAFPVAFYLSYALAQFERRCVLLDGIGGMLNQQAAQATPEDAIIAVSFRPYSSSVVGVVTDRFEAGVPIISITDSSLSPLALECSVFFETFEREDSGFRTLMAPMCLAQTLVVSLGHYLAALENGGSKT